MSHRTARLPYPYRRATLVFLAATIFAVPLAVAHGSELRQTPIVKAVQQARPAVVNIHGEKTLQPANRQVGHAEVGRRVNGMGTGVIFDGRGYIVTNYHVVDGVRKIQVTLAGGEQLIARLISRDPETDLAVIKVDSPQALPTINMGTSRDLMPGETVVAVGNAFGYEHTVTQGIISALHRAVQVSDAQYYEDLIQTDASINPGNSGGPLLNIDGEMIGINVAVRAGAQGIGFAIPVDKAIGVASRLLAAYNMKSSWHGVVLESEPGRRCGGLAIKLVEAGSPAAKADLRVRDVITAVDGMEVNRPLDFHRALMDRKVGDTVEISLNRGRESFNFALTLADVPEHLHVAATPSWELLGMELRAIPHKQFRSLYNTRYRGGLTVASVRPDSPAADQGIRRGDVLVGMHIWETISLDNVSYILGRTDLRSHDPIKFYILRGSDTLYGYLPTTSKNAQ